jgi:uncharacterized protein (TIGR02246 family)
MHRPLLLFIVALLTVSPVYAQAPSAAERELIKLENEWSTAWLNKDGAFLQKLYADEYMFTSESGSTYNRAQDIAETTSAANRNESFLLADLKVHVYRDTAVVTGLNTLKSSTASGKDTSGVYRFTDVFVKRDGRWQVVASQSTRVLKQ